jgi:hypothetical protein
MHYSQFENDSTLAIKTEDMPVSQTREIIKNEDGEMNISIKIESFSGDLSKDSQNESHRKHNREERGKPNSKHIIKNYGKALCTFACSNVAKPYLEDIHKHESITKVITVQDFQVFIKGKRDIIDSMKSIRDILLIKQSDNKILVAYKKMLQKISIIFIKYFSINWIFQGKMKHKQIYVNSRFKILRRIKDPQHFTYFQAFAKR